MTSDELTWWREMFDTKAPFLLGCMCRRESLCEVRVHLVEP